MAFLNLVKKISNIIKSEKPEKELYKKVSTLKNEVTDLNKLVNKPIDELGNEKVSILKSEMQYLNEPKYETTSIQIVLIAIVFFVFSFGVIFTKDVIGIISLLPTPFGAILMFSLLLIPGAIVLFLPNISKDTRKIIMGWSCACFIIGLYFSMFFIGN